MTHQEEGPIYHVLVTIDGATEEVVTVVRIAGFNLATFCEQFDVPVQYDPQMLDRYAVGPDDVEFLNDHLSESVYFDFTSFGYWIEAMRP